MLNIEIKPTPGTERRTGEVVAAHAARWWQDASVPPLLTSFQPAALEGAMAGAPHLPRGLLMDEFHPAWRSVAQALACVAVVFNHRLWTAALVAQAREGGLRCLAYTVNDEADAQRLLAIGLDGLITDKVDMFPAD